MSNLSVLYRRVKKLVFFLIIFYLVRSYYLRRKRGGNSGKRLTGPPERKRITDGREKESKATSKDSENEEEKITSDSSKHEKSTDIIDNTETAVNVDVDDDSKKEDHDISLSVTEEIKDPNNLVKDSHSLDIDKTEMINDIVNENIVEPSGSREIIVNNIETLPTTIMDNLSLQKLDKPIEKDNGIPEGNQYIEIIEEIEEIRDATDEEEVEPKKIDLKATENKIEESLPQETLIKPTPAEEKVIEDPLDTSVEEQALDDIIKQFNEPSTPSEDEENTLPKNNELIDKVEKVIEEPEKLVEILEEIVIPSEEPDNVKGNPEKVDVIVESSEESEIELSQSSLVETPPKETSQVLSDPSIEEEIEASVELEPEIVEEIIDNENKPEVVEEVIDNENKPEVVEEVIDNENKPEVVEEVIDNEIKPEKEGHFDEENVELVKIEELPPSNDSLEESVTEQPQIPEDMTEEIIQLPTVIEEPLQPQPVEVASEVDVPKVEEKIIEGPLESKIEENVTKDLLEPKIEEKIVDDLLVEDKIKLEEKSQEASANETPIIQEPPVLDEKVSETIEKTELPEVVIETASPLLKEETKEVIEEGSRDLPSVEKDPQSIDLLINEIEKVVNDSESDISFVKENDHETEKEKETEVIPKKPVINAADIVGHEEIIYEGEIDGDEDDGEWIDEDDDDGEWIDEDDGDSEWVDEDDDDEDQEEEEVKKPEITNKRQSLLINTNPVETAQKRQSLIFNNTPIDNKRRSLLLNTPIDVLKSSLLTPMHTNTSATFPIPNPAPTENKPKVLPDAILDRIFREVDPQTMWVLRNTSLKTRAIIDNILKETFEQFDLSMDPLYFDVTSKENLGLVLNSLDLSPFALAMLLHEILKLDSQRIGYAFGQMFRVPSKISEEYLTDLIVDTLNILKTKKGVDIASVMLGLQHYYCFNHSELEFYQLFDLIEMTPQEVARFIQNHYHFILSKSLPPLLSALDVDEVYVAELCKAYANEDMDAFARIISKVPVHLVRTSIHPDDVQGERVVVVNENGEDVIVVLNNNDKENPKTGPMSSLSQPGKNPVETNNDEWEEEEDDEDESPNLEGMNNDSTIIVENNESFSLMIGRILRFLNMSTKDVASFFKYLPEYCSYDEEEILEGLNWNEEQINEMRQIMKDEQDKIARKMKELSKLIIQRRLSISGGANSPLGGSPIGRSPSASSSNGRYY